MSSITPKSNNNSLIQVKHPPISKQSVVLVLLLPAFMFLSIHATVRELQTQSETPPQQWSMYIAIAFSETHAQTFSRAFNKTMNNVTRMFMDNYHQHNITVSPLIITLPENQQFSAAILEETCALLEGKHLVAALIIGGSPAGFAVALAAGTAGIPVLWARGGTGDLVGYFQLELSPLEVRLEPSAGEMLEAMRALLLATHWHSFTVLADSSASSAVLLRRDLASILNAPPLNPTLLLLRSGGAARRSIFRRLADISRSTRGVILLICNLETAKQITTEAERLNMMSGHFVWLWIDTGASAMLAAQRNAPFPADDSTRNDANNNNATIDYPATFEQPITQIPTKSRSRSSSSKRHERESGDNGTQWGPSSDNNSNFVELAYAASGPEKAQTGIRKTRNSVKEISGSVQDMSTSSLFSSKTKSESSRMKSRDTPSDVLRTSSQRENVISVHDMKNIKDTFANAASRGMGFKNLELISGSDDSGSRYVQNSLKASVGVHLLGQDRIGDLVNFRDTKLRSESVQNVRSASDMWVYQEKKNSDSQRFKVNFPGFNDDGGDDDDVADALPVGLLAMRTKPMRLDRHLVKGAVRLIADTLLEVLSKCMDWLPAPPSSNNSCWTTPSGAFQNFSSIFASELRAAVRDALAGRRVSEVGDKVDRSLVASFDILNLVPQKSATDYDGTLGVNEPEGDNAAVSWKSVGEVTGRAVRLDTIVWPGGELVVAGLSARARSVFRIVTALAPPFVMEGELDEDGQCLRGLPCHRVLTSDKDNLTLVFNEMETHERLEEEDEELPLTDEESMLNILTVKKESKIVSHDTEFQHHNQNSEDVRRRPLASSSSTFELPNNQQRYNYRTSCCYGLAMDLLENIAQELEFDFHLYIVADGLFGTRTRDVQPQVQSRSKNTVTEPGDTKWNGIVGDIVSGAAHMSFAALSVSSARSEVIDFSAPYFYSGVSFLAAPTQKSEIPLLAFLLPFSPELWIAIFTSLNITAMAVAVYEWLSPFGLNPWGRQRSKNFSIASALWVMWGLLCGHLVAFKAPKSWPNKFLINVWGGFSVIFVASYTANIAALIAGLFFHNDVSNYHDRSLLSQRVGAPRASAADYYVHRANQHLWEHMQKYSLIDVEDGIRHLKNGSLDILIADTPILDYYRATDHGCKLQKIGDAINEDTYAVGMTKGFPLKDSISAVIAKYSRNGYIDILQEKWYGGLPCFKLATDMAQPQPLGVAAVTGVFILLGLGMVLGCLILIFEHLFYRYTLPILRHQPKGTIWRSRNIMFFSQKLYRFINCVELVSPHHAARELVHTIRQGQITSLFQKSVKRKEHEQRRRRKSKAQFFEMIQEIRRVQQEERDQSVLQEEVPETEAEPSSNLIKTEYRSNKNPQSPLCPPSKSSPRKFGKTKSPHALEARKFYRDIFSPGGSRNTKFKSPNAHRRFSTDMIFSPLRSRLECPSNAVGRRLSKDSGGCNSPPDINSRLCSNLDVSARQDKLSSLDVRFQQGRSHLDVRLPDTRSSGSSLNIIPRLGSSSNTNVSSSKHEIGGRRPEVSSVQERLNTIGSRLGSLSSTDVSSRPEKLSRSRSRSPIPSIMNKSFPSSSNGTSNMSTIPKYRDRVRSDTCAREAMQSRPRLRTPSPTEIQVDVIQHRDLNSTSGRSHSLDNNRVLSQEDEIKPAPESDGTIVHHQKLKRSDFTLPYESIIEVNVTCCDSTPEKTNDYSATYNTPSRSHDSASQEHINVSGSSPSPYSSLRRQQFRRRQSHQPRLETAYNSHHQVLSPSSSSQSSTKEFLVPVQRHENSSSSSSSRSPARRRHQSHPVRTDLPSQDKSSLATSSSIPDVSSAVSPNRQKHHRHHRHHRESSHECDEVFDDIPPPPPPPFCHPRSGSNGESPLDRLNKEELVALWRSSESELRSHLLRAIRAKEVTDPP